MLCSVESDWIRRALANADADADADVILFPEKEEDMVAANR
jgi:hypothetical protein